MPFDPAFYRAQAGPVPEGMDPLAHYLSEGWRVGHDPTPFFASRWYTWQNPDWNQSFATPYDHFLQKGRHEGRDPSPLVDVTRYLSATGDTVAPGEVYARVLAGMRAPALGVYEHLDDVTHFQRLFRESIRISCLRQPARNSGRRNLVFLQTGPSSRHREWLSDGPRNWDLLVNYYDMRGHDPALGDYVFAQAGTKFTAMAKLARTRPEILLEYDHVLFLDDDILTSMEDLNRLFAIVSDEGIDLAQMALAEGSHCMWPALFGRRSDEGLRHVSAVEIMMPVFSRRALARLWPSFEDSVSGFGLDLLWGEACRGWGGRVCVIDFVTARHEASIDDKAGAYYTYMRNNLINPKAELWRLVQQNDLPQTIG